MKSPVVQVKFTKGFGNNLFQYMYARLLAEFHDGKVSVHDGKVSVKTSAKLKSSIKEFAALGIELENLTSPRLPSINIKDTKASIKFYEKKFNGHNFNLKGYFENYKLYIEHRDLIKSWVKPIPKDNTRDLVFHLRLGDRLFIDACYQPGMKVSASQYVNAINKFKFDKLHIVTDMKFWGILTKDILSNLSFHTGGLGGRDILQGKTGVKNYDIPVNYFNSIYDALSQFNPIVRCDCEVADDFNYIRSFDKILFQHGTMAWWASFLSEASEVGVYKLWRPSKGKKNKNLGQTDIEGWHHWS